MTQKNLDIKAAIIKAGVRQWRVAQMYGICEGNFCRLLRKELDGPVKKRIFTIIKELKEAKQ